MVIYLMAQDKGENRTLVIVPAYNEEKNLAELIREIQEELPGLEIVVIDDGSHDKTAEMASKLGAEVLELPYNLGIGGAVQTGYKFALEMGYDVVIRVDGDRQHPPSEAKKVAVPVLNGEADMAVGSRYLGEGDYEPQILRKMGTNIFSVLVSLMIKQKVTDATSGFAVLNRDAMEILCHESPRDYPEVESIVILHKKKMRIAEVGVRMKKREGGRSSIRGWKQAYYMIKVMLSLLIRLGEEKELKEERK
jgi:hypothetical protein